MSQMMRNLEEKKKFNKSPLGTSEKGFLSEEQMSSHRRLEENLPLKIKKINFIDFQEKVFLKKTRKSTKEDKKVLL